MEVLEGCQEGPAMGGVVPGARYQVIHFTPQECHFFQIFLVEGENKSLHGTTSSELGM